jgi:hypothetical protein
VPAAAPAPAAWQGPAEAGQLPTLPGVQDRVPESLTAPVPDAEGATVPATESEGFKPPL